MTLWGKFEDAFDADRLQRWSSDEPVMILFVGMSVAEFNGTLAFKSTLTTWWYINPTIPETAAILERLSVPKKSHMEKTEKALMVHRLATKSKKAALQSSYFLRRIVRTLMVSKTYLRLELLNSQTLHHQLLNHQLHRVSSCPFFCTIVSLAVKMTTQCIKLCTPYL